MKTVIIDYGAGNVESVVNALSAVNGSDEIVISNKISDIRSDNHLVLAWMV